MAITKVVLTANGNIKLTDASDSIQHILPASMSVSVDPRDENGIRISEEANPENEDTAIRFRWNDLTVPAGLTDRDDCLVQLERDFFKGAAASTSGSSTKSSITSSATAGELVAANASRKGVWISNLSDKKLFVSLGTGDAVLDDDNMIPSLESIYISTTERISVISEAGPTGKIVATEMQ